MEYTPDRPLESAIELMSETKKRTVVRMTTYRVSAWLLSIPITYWLTGDLREAIGGSTVLHVVLSIDYYVHERIWLTVKWGRSV